MPTAATTPRLGLPSPVDSDIFSAADFATTAAKLDATPGITIVANYTALTALPWGVNQNGSTAYQMDTGAMWVWVNPSGSGNWVRVNSVGKLAQVSQGADVSSSAMSGNGIQVVSTGNITFPGRKLVHIECYLACDNTSGQSGLVYVTLTDSGTVLRNFIFRAGLPYGGAGTRGTDQYIEWNINNPAPVSTHNIAVYIRSAAGSPANGAGGTSSARQAVLSVYEV